MEWVNLFNITARVSIEWRNLAQIRKKETDVPSGRGQKYWRSRLSMIWSLSSRNNSNHHNPLSMNKDQHKSAKPSFTRIVTFSHARFGTDQWREGRDGGVHQAWAGHRGRDGGTRTLDHLCIEARAVALAPVSSLRASRLFTRHALWRPSNFSHAEPKAQ